MPPKTSNSTRRNLMIDSSLWEELVELSDVLTGKPSISSLVRIAIEKYLEDRNPLQVENEKPSSTAKNTFKPKIISIQSSTFEINRLKIKSENINRKLETLQETLDVLNKRDLGIDKKINDIQSERVNSFKSFENQIETLTQQFHENIEKIKRLKRQDEIGFEQKERDLMQEKENLKVKKSHILQEQENAKIKIIDCDEEIFNLENS